MAEVTVDGTEIVVRMAALEVLSTWRREVRVPLSRLKMVQVEESPMVDRSLLRLPGLSWPRAFCIGQATKGGRRELAVVNARTPAVVMDLEGARWDRLVVSQADAAAIAAELAALLLGRGPGKSARRGAFEGPLD